MVKQKITMGIRGIVPGSNTDKIYKFVVKKRAVITDEIAVEFPEIKKHHISSYLKQVQKQGFIVKSKTRAQSLKRKCSGSFVWGIDDEAVNEKLYLLSKKVNKKELLTGVKKAISDIVNSSDIAYTTSEVKYELNLIGIYKDYVSYDYIYTCLRELVRDGIIKRSQFMMPNTAMVNGQKPGYLYGRDDNSIAKKTLALMPPEVRDAFLMIRQSNDLYPIDIIEERFKVTNQDVKSWFDYRACTVGWLKVYSYKMRRYYHSPTLNQKYVEETAPKIHETEIVKSIFNTMNLGVEFEKQAIFYWVMYLTHRYGLQIRLNEDFPKHIPSWFNPNDLKKYTENGECHKPIVDVWKFDSEPIDYLIFCYDDITKCPIQGYAISIKRDHKSHMLGNAGKNYIASFVGCLSKGFSFDLKHIPSVNSLTPLIIMNNPNGGKLFDWARKTGCVLLYSTIMERIIKYLNDEVGLKYDNDMKLSDIRQYKELLEQYKDHKDVIIGKIKPEDLVRFKSENGGNNGTNS